jgi:CNT family concentrative nucleoside transporter
MNNYVGWTGVATMIALAALLSSDRRRISPRIILGGVALQLLLAWLLLAFRPVADAFEAVARVVTRVVGFADAGARFVFGELVDPTQPWGFIFAVKALTVIIFFASLMGVLYHWGIMQRVIAALAWVLRRSIGVTGTEAIAMAANVFVGQTEAPLCVKPFVPTMTRSQLTTLMVGGFATIAGSVMAAYISILGGGDEARGVLFAKHLLTASVMSAPAALVIAKILTPETEAPPSEAVHLELEQATVNTLDAAASGASDGLRLALNVGAMLIAFVSLLALVNWPIEALGEWGPIRAWREAREIGPLSLQMILGWLLAPLAWTMGAPWSDCVAFGSLLGEKLVATEFVAYLSLARDMNAADALLQPRSAQIAAYALCGFANFPSIAIQIGGLSAIAPNRRADLASLGLRAMLGGALASWMTAAIAGLFI